MPRENLSSDPRAVRQRIRRHSRRTEADMKMLADQHKPLEEWDLEELARGRPRCSDGSFKGPVPKWITPVVVKESKRRLRLGALDMLGVMVGDAIRVVHEMMMNDDVDDTGRPIVDSRTRLQCAMFIIDHVVGKATVRNESEDEAAFKGMLARALVMRDHKGNYVNAHPVIELTSDEWTDDDDAE
jgi:hypothetical protein